MSIRTSARGQLTRLRSRLADWARDTGRLLLAAALVGFVGGAFSVSMIVWQFGNVIGSRAASERWPAAPTAVVDRWGTASDVEIRATDGELLPIAEGPATVLPGLPPRGIPSIGPDPLTALRDRKLQLPVPGVAREQLRPSFSDSRGASRAHEAIDILAPRNTPVLAVEDGTIARLFHSKVGGITIYQFDPSREYVYYYAHLERYADGLRDGDHIRRGQVIGYVGTTGNAPTDRPHLHFAIYKTTEASRWWSGRPVDPFLVFR